MQQSRTQRVASARRPRNGFAVVALLLTFVAQAVAVPVVSAATAQIITFGLPATSVVGSTAELTGTASSGLTVTYTSSTPGVCTLGATTITLDTVGTCSVTASQAGDVDWDPADDVVATIEVVEPPPEPAAQFVTFGLPADGFVGSTADLTATASSGLTVTYASSTPEVCTLGATTVSLDTIGTCSVTASQGGDADWAPADDVVATIDVAEPPPVPVAQTITFSLPATGFVGSTAELAATASSGLAVSFASTTPGVCTLAATTVSLETVGTCSVTASQAGDPDWAPADDVVATIEVRLTPLTTIDGTNLGRYAFNGTIRAMTVDPDSGTVYVGGVFTQVGIRTGSVAAIDGPDSGSDRLRGTSPDVIGNSIAAFADDASGYFLTGGISSIRGDGVRRSSATRMTADGHVDPSWQFSDPCDTQAWPRWDIGDHLVSTMSASSDGSGLSTVGLQFIDKSTGEAAMVGAGTDPCRSSSSIWPSIGPFAPLAACVGWNICVGYPMDVAIDPAAHTMIVAMQVTSRQTADSAYRSRTYLVGYDTDAGTRTWTLETEHPDVPDWYPPQAIWGGHIAKMVGLGGSLLVAGEFPFEHDPSTKSTMILVDEATGTVLQRWNAGGEQDLADPASTVAPATSCTPADDGLRNNINFQFTRTSASSAVGYASVVDIPGGHQLTVCSYATTGSGSTARLAATALGTLDAVPDPNLVFSLPSTLYANRYLVGGNGAFDLDTGSQVADWNPSPSQVAQSTLAIGSSIVFAGDFAFFHGTASNHVAALDADLAPIPGFVAELVDFERSSDGMQDVRALEFVDGRLLVAGDLKGDFGRGPVVALDAITGALDWARAESTITIGHAVAVDPATQAFYLATERFGNGDLLTRYVPVSGGFALDDAFSHPIGAYGSAGRYLTGLAVSGGKLYIGGLFGSIDGQPRQGLARLAADGTLDAWAPAVIDEMAVPPDGSIEMQPRAFVEVGSSVVVSGVFQYLTPIPGGGGYSGHALSEVLVYSADTGARELPAGTNDPWFPPSYSYGAYDMALIDDTIYVAFGSSGIAAFDSTTFEYLPSQSIRTQPGWDNSAIYAIAGRAPSPAPVASASISMFSTQVAVVEAESTIVLGGTLTRWRNDTAGNVVEIAPVTVPGPPVGVTAGPRNTGATVAWGQPASDGGASITGYTATASPGGRTCATTGALTCIISGLVNGTSYTVTVAATNSEGTGPSSALSLAVIPRTVPSVPTNVTAVPTLSTAKVAWHAPASTGGSSITGYTATASPGGKSCTTTSALTCTITGMADGLYTVFVKARNAAGTGPASAASGSFRIDRTAPTVAITSPAASTKATTIPYAVTFIESVTGLSAADFGRTGTATGCVVGTPTGSGATYNVSVSGCSAGTLILTLKASTVIDLATNPGPTVAATAATVTIDRTVPTATAPITSLRSGVPLAGTAIPVTLTWTGADTGGAGIARYELARSADGGTTWTVISTALTTPTTTSTMASSGSVRFRVRSVDKAGNIGAWATGSTLSPALVQQTSTVFKYSGTWTNASSTSYSGSSVKYASVRGASVSYTFTGRAVAIVTTKSATRGKANVYLDGALVGTIDHYSATTSYRSVVWAKSWAAAGTHTVKIVVVGTSGRPRLDIDAMAVVK